MWPKALAQLIELSPHLIRLVPMADRFLQSKSATDDANRQALEAMAEGLKGDLGQVTASHAGLYRQLNDQSEKLAQLSLELHATKSAAQSTEMRVVFLEQRLSFISKLLVVSTVFTVVLLVLVTLVLFRH